MIKNSNCLPNNIEPMKRQMETMIEVLKIMVMRIEKILNDLNLEK